MRQLLAGALLLLTGGCARIEVGRVESTTTVPTIRVALEVNARGVQVGGGEALSVSEPDGRTIGRIPRGEVATAELGPDGHVLLRFRGGATLSAELPSLAAEDRGKLIQVDGRSYRGTMTILGEPRGMTPVNHVTVQEYLYGVVNAEMGRRGTRELEALRAQAVVSRTVALRAIKRWGDRGYDVRRTVDDQAYGGVASERDQGRAAVDETAGEVLTDHGGVIEAFFSSTCGGRTAEGGEVFVGARGLAYLPSQSDTDPSGTAWCSISPRFRWTESWSRESLAEVLRSSLSRGRGRGLTAAGVRDIVVTDRTASGRVGGLSVRTNDGTIRVPQAEVRSTIHPVGEGLLRSAAFRLISTKRGTQLVRLEAEGGGAGHGVGMCQWGAVGRARAGSSYQAILTAYFPGTDLSRVY